MDARARVRGFGLSAVERAVILGETVQRQMVRSERRRGARGAIYSATARRAPGTKKGEISRLEKRLFVTLELELASEIGIWDPGRQDVTVHRARAGEMAPPRGSATEVIGASLCSDAVLRADRAYRGRQWLLSEFHFIAYRRRASPRSYRCPQVPWEHRMADINVCSSLTRLGVAYKGGATTPSPWRFCGGATPSVNFNVVGGLASTHLHHQLMHTYRTSSNPISDAPLELILSTSSIATLTKLKQLPSEPPDFGLSNDTKPAASHFAQRHTETPPETVPSRLRETAS